MKKQVYIVGAAFCLVIGMAAALVWQDADLTGNFAVDMGDLAYMSPYLGWNNCTANNSFCNGADINEDSHVDAGDIGILAHYLGCNNASNTSNGSQCAPI